MEKNSKKTKEESEEKEESELEEEIEEAEQELDEEKFVEFLSPSEQNFSSSLGQVAIATELRATNLEQDLSQTPSNNESSKSQEEFKYNIGSNQGEEAKYITSGKEIEKFVEPSYTDLVSLGKEQNSVPQEIGFNPSPSTQIREEKNIEKYVLPRKTDVSKLGKENLFEKSEVKYKPSL